MEKSEILEKIEAALSTDNAARNSMGVSESFYDPYYLIGMCFTDNKNREVLETELFNMSETDLNSIMRLAKYASDVFY